MTTGVGSVQDLPSLYRKDYARVIPSIPTEKIRDEIDALFDSGRDLSEVLEDVARLGARLIMQAAVEAEVAEFLGRARYQRRTEVPEARAGSRNGYCPTTVKTTAGRSPWIGRSCAAPTRSSCPGCSTPACPRPTRWRPW